MTNQPRIPRPTIDQEAVLTHLRAARGRPTPVAIWTAIADIPVLLAAARATLTADQDGEPDPLTYLHDAVAEHRAWIPPDDGELAE